MKPKQIRCRCADCATDFVQKTLEYKISLGRLDNLSIHVAFTTRSCALSEKTRRARNPNGSTDGYLHTHRSGQLHLHAQYWNDSCSGVREGWVSMSYWLGVYT